MSWNQRLWYGIGGERGLSASIITIRGGGEKKKNNLPVTEKRGRVAVLCRVE